MSYNNYIDLIVEFQRGDELKLCFEGCDKEMRKRIQRYCEGNGLFYKNVYVENDNITIIWKCDSCGYWNKDSQYEDISTENENLVECICLHCEDSEDIDLDSGYKEGYLNIIHELEADGRMLIMKRDNIPPYKNDLGPGECYRGY